MLMLLMVTVGCSSSDDAPPAATTYTISGVVSGDIAAGVTINLTTGAATATTTTATDGTYSFTGLANGTYTVKPALSDYIFNPFSTVVIVNGSSMVADFIAATAPTTLMSISGTVYLGAAHTTRLAGVTVNLTGTLSGSVITDADGWYSFDGIGPGSYTVTPHLSGYAFVDSATDTDPFIDITLVGSSSGNNDFDATAANFTQADLEGTWDARALATGSSSGWMRGTATADASGNITFSNCSDSSGGATCPEGPIVWAIDTTTGVISETDDGSGTDSHYTMASNKKFIAGTQNQGTTERALLIAQKKVDGTVYEDTDVQSKNFVFHGLMVGDNQGWEYAVGTTNGAGLVTLTTHVNQNGSEPTGATDVTFSVDGNGIVTVNAGADIGENFNGFLSADKRTIVGVVTEDSVDDYYHLYVIQITNDQSSSTSGGVGTWYNHMLTVGSGTDVPFWAHQSIDITSAGVMTFDDWVASSAATGPDSGTTYTLSVGPSGTATITQSIGSTDFHGQVSHDGTFMIGTQTFGTGAYSLMAVTKASSTIIPDPDPE
jgi:hypothetical protein